MTPVTLKPEAKRTAAHARGVRSRKRTNAAAIRALSPRIETGDDLIRHLKAKVGRGLGLHLRAP